MAKRSVAILISSAVFFGAAALGGSPAFSQSATPGVSTAKPAKPAQPTGGMSFNDRRKKCSAEWKEAKANKTTQGMSWPKFWSACNKRLKAQAT